MINQQLLDFIEGQLSNGITREAITNSLKSNGWPEEDIKEAFISINNNVNPPSTPNRPENLSVGSQGHSSKKIGLIVIVLILLVGGVSAYYLINDMGIVKDQDIDVNNPVSGTEQEGEASLKIESPKIVEPIKTEPTKITTPSNAINPSLNNCNIPKDSLPVAGTAIYISYDTSSASINGFKFSQINFMKNEVRMNVSHVSTDKVETVNFSLNKPMIVFCQTMTLVGIREKEHTIDGEILKYLTAEIQING